jgi:hypothetical protein
LEEARGRKGGLREERGLAKMRKIVSFREQRFVNEWSCGAK